ncbi:preprotein translocase subunit YajC [Nocardioides sp. SYSU DS0663]|uniref:preprotein translocase subunit YajC n=1 Tax=Nocardioides sp. SYSU DS0663 TaxID=3416445 RepID=UPI003F4C26BA
MQELASLLPLVGIALLFWLLIIRPASRRQKELARMQSSLTVGDEVVLTSGFLGTVRELHDDTVRLELAEGVVVTVARGAIGTIAPQQGLVDDEPKEI